MAIVSTTNIGQNKARLRNMVRYIVNENKTQNSQLIYAQNSTVETFAMQTEMLYSQRNYIDGRTLKSGALTGVIAHEMPSDDLTQKEIEETHNGDVDSIRENLIAQGKNPDDYLILASTHIDTDRHGDHGRIHTHFIICRINCKDIPAPLVRNDRDNWEQFSKIVHKNNPLETKTLESYRATVRAEIAKRGGQPHRKFIEKQPDLSSLASSISDPNTTITYHIDAKRRWETIISDTNLNYFQRREALLKCDIDDSIETVKENYKNGVIKELNFKAFLNEMNHRGYSYKQNNKNSKSNYVMFSHKNWPKYKNKKGEMCPPNKKRFKEYGYTKDDIIARIDGTLHFEPKHATVMVWNNIEQMPNDRKLKKEAEYINNRNARKCFKNIRALNWVIGDTLIGTLISLLLAFILVATKPKLKDIYQKLYTEDYNKRIEIIKNKKAVATGFVATTIKNNDAENFYNMVSDFRTEIDNSNYQPSTEIGAFRYDFNKWFTDNQHLQLDFKTLSNLSAELNNFKIRWDLIPKLLKTTSKKADESHLETQINTITNADSSESITKNEKEGATGFVAPVIKNNHTGPTGLVGTDQVAEDTGFVSSAYTPSKKETDYFFNQQSLIQTKFLQKENLPNNQRAFANSELAFLTNKFNNDYPNFAEWVNNKYNRDSKPQAIVDYGLEWFKNFANKDDYQYPVDRWKSKYPEPTFEDIYLLEQADQYNKHYQLYKAGDNTGWNEMKKDLKRLKNVDFIPVGTKASEIKKELKKQIVIVKTKNLKYYDDCENHYNSIHNSKHDIKFNNGIIQNLQKQQSMLDNVLNKSKDDNDPYN